jgi:hypothetical protein
MNQHDIREKHKDRLLVAIVITFMIFVIYVIASSIYSYVRSHPDIVVTGNNRDKFALVVIYIDVSRSIKDKDFSAAKKIAVENIIPYIGIGDKVVCFIIGPKFGIDNRIFGEYSDQIPYYLYENDSKLEKEKVLEILNQRTGGKVTHSDVYELIKELRPHWQKIENIRNDWKNLVLKIERPREDGTVVGPALRAIEEFFKGADDQEVEDKWLFIISDLKDEPPGRHSHAIDKYKPDPNVFNDVNVVLIYPTDSDSEWVKIIDYWSGCFSNSNLRKCPSLLATIQDLLPPNPTSGLEKYKCDKFWTYFQPLLFRGVVSLVITLVLIFIVFIVYFVYTKRASKLS